MTEELIPQLIDGLRNARKDGRLARVLSLEERSGFTLWIVEGKQSGVASRLLYGWVISSTLSESTKKWAASEFHVDGNTRLARLTTTDTGAAIITIIEQLLQGRNLGAVSEALGIQKPKYGASLRLVGTQGNIARNYQISSIVILETRDSFSDRVRTAQPMQSPNSAVPGFSISFYLVEKAKLWSDDVGDSGSRPLFPRSVAYTTIERLAEETGLDFRAADAARLGNIEFIGFPSANAKEEPLVYVKVISRLEGDSKRAEGVQVAFRTGVLTANDEIIVRLQQQSGREVVLDTCQLTNGATEALVFRTVEPLGGTSVQVWRRAVGTTEPFVLWFSQKYHWFTRLVLNMGIAGLSGQIDSDLIKAFKSPRLTDRVSKLLTFSQIHYRRSVSGETEHPWETSTRMARDLASRLFPSPSGAKFFPKGWDSEGRLSFLEWLLQVAKSIQIGRMVVVDPFFDSVGVEMLARMEQTQVAYAALTSTQVSSEDDEEGKPDRAQRILAMCAQLSPVFRSINLRIYDIRTGSKKRRPLHDRYVILLGGDDEVVRGYHMSNSIQHATRTYPLLVTPIPDDVLESVSGYLQGVINCDKDIVGDASVDLLYESPRGIVDAPVTALARWDTEVLTILLCTKVIYPAETECSIVPLAHDEVARAAYDSWSSANCPEGCDLNTWLEAELLLRLSRQGWSVRGMADVRSKIKSDGIPLTGVPALARRMKIANRLDLHRLWSTWGEICSNALNGREARSTLLSSGEVVLPQSLLRELETVIECPPPGGLVGLQVVREVETLAHHFHRNFLESLDQVRYFLDRGQLRVHGIGLWGARAAISALAELAPEELVAFAARIESQSRDAKGLTSAPHINLLSLIVQQFCERVSLGKDERLIKALLVSECGFLRAIGARAVSLRMPREVATELLRLLSSDIEAIHALAEWVSDLRAIANRADSVEPTELVDLRLSLFQEMQMRWPSIAGNGTPSLHLRSVFARLSGPQEGSWALTTVNEFFLPLVNRNLLALEDVAELVFSIVMERIAKNSLKFESGSRAGGRGYQYSSRTDTELTEVAAALNSQVNRDSRSANLARLQKQLRICSRTLLRPFARSINYDGWVSARDALRWGAVFYGSLWTHGEAFGLEDGELDAIQRALEEIWDVLDQRCIQELHEDVTGLRGIEEGVRLEVCRRIAARTNRAT